MPVRKASDTRTTMTATGRMTNIRLSDHNANPVSTEVATPPPANQRRQLRRLGPAPPPPFTTNFRYAPQTTMATVRLPSPVTVAARNSGSQSVGAASTMLRQRPIRPSARVNLGGGSGAAGPPPVITENSARRNRLTLVASRRRTTLATASIPREQDNPNNTSDAFNNHNHNGPQRFSLSSFANRLFSRPSRDRSPSPSSHHNPRSRVTFSTPNLEMGPVAKVLEGSEKYLPKILNLLNWNELLPMRSVCKKWLEVISSESNIQDRMGVITIRNAWQDKFEIFNNSPVIWTKFRILDNIYIDLMDSVQLQFWMKHGPTMKFLEIKNNSMTLTGLVEVLSRCPNLVEFLVSWTPEMYPFNSELIKKYYGINFYNGTFASMQKLTVERSSYLTDNALLSMLKWCGGPLKSLSLTYLPEKQQDPLTRLKPRWTVHPIRNYFERFGYTGKLQELNFSWSNISPMDLITLANIEHLSSLKGITLSHTKIDDDSLAYFLLKKGHDLEKVIVEDVALTEGIFEHKTPLHHLKFLNISGEKGDFKNLAFLSNLVSLEEFSAANTSWLDYNKLMPPLKTKKADGKQLLKAVDFGGSIKVNGTKQIDANMNRVWFSNLVYALANVVKLNLNYWGHFGKNENFRMICQKMPKLEELRLRGWKELNDSGVTGLQPDKLHSHKHVVISTREQKERVFVGSLKNLSVLDLSGCSISDASIKYGISFVPYLRKFYFDNTEVSDMGVNFIVQSYQTIDRISFSGCEKVVIQKRTKFQRHDGRFIYADKF